MILFDIAHLPNQYTFMRDALARFPHEHDTYMRAYLIVLFIDGLVKAPPGKDMGGYYEKYLGEHFSGLCAEISAKDFYKYIRCTMTHGFAPKPPYALAYGDTQAPYITEYNIDGVKWKALNVQRLETDFLAHIALLERANTVPTPD